ncbi:winged helix-turn-helix domain-containing protein [Pseudomonas sp.]|uniref:winged helix-turn-helix domain-containing protein n=1 Tax=Pseudomonas sp. TaxID=306 RepID=UPI003C52D5DD
MVVVDNQLTTHSLFFAQWTLHGDGRLTGAGADVQLPPKEWHVLRLLLVSGSVLMTKDRLLELAWPQGDVSEESLTRCIYSLRKYLGADKGFIKTIYGRGYRFTCPVRTDAGQAPGGMRQVEHVCSVCGQVSHGQVMDEQIRHG